MPQNRFYLDVPFVAGQTVKLEDTEYHHLKVLRCELGEEIDLVNGHGLLAKAKLLKVEKHAAYLQLLECNEEPHLFPRISLCLALIRMNRLEWTIEKATELGANALYLFAADFSEKENLSQHQLERLRHLSVSALKQCGRLYLPKIEIFRLEDLLAQESRILFGDIDPEAPRLATLKITADTLFFSGPEKGFSAREEALLKEKGIGVKLSHNILRAETAPIAALSILFS